MLKKNYRVLYTDKKMWQQFFIVNTALYNKQTVFLGVQKH